jgi:hypothetical protein
MFPPRCRPGMAGQESPIKAQTNRQPTEREEREREREKRCQAKHNDVTWTRIRMRWANSNVEMNNRVLTRVGLGGLGGNKEKSSLGTLCLVCCAVPRRGGRRPQRALGWACVGVSWLPGRFESLCMIERRVLYVTVGGRQDKVVRGRRAGDGWTSR